MYKDEFYSNIVRMVEKESKRFWFKERSKHLDFNQNTNTLVKKRDHDL
jgi:hypothetical protein